MMCILFIQVSVVKIIVAVHSGKWITADYSESSFSSTNNSNHGSLKLLKYFTLFETNLIICA